MIKNITVEEALDLYDAVIIDVRSGGEFSEGTIPGAVNLSLLNDEERARVGAEYKQKGPKSARRLGLEIVSPKLVEMVREFEGLAGRGKKMVLFCWRGGMRSQYMAQILDMMGFNIYRIEGGYKAYRRYISRYLDGCLPHSAVVVCGLTGVGKTLVLKKLSERGLPVLDLEGLALHRGSVYGKVGLPPSPTQRLFEGHIYSVLKEAESKGVFLVECESRRLGRLLVPPAVVNAMKRGYKILLYAPLEVRIRRSLEEYISGFDEVENKAQLLKATGSLLRYLGRKRVEFLSDMIAGGRMDKAVELLLLEYYDPLYKFPDRSDPGYHLSVDASNIEQAVEEIHRFVTGLVEYNIPVNGGVPNGNREYTENRQGIQGDFPGGR